ncbi:GntR family transcriptional regulator [Stutzerimonas zhaodongensis]|uniref:GntR family transcriptional regulator n=1 Tax=Stutzerimonas zhaodongensis TaxID=1176257 RepID=A0A3M2HD10_9GAMM|nr:GntR family transcriptional regulator [Stutzerimonas zhaodongensis]MCQ4317850.1 GntR family transcriptional regulator [Stutzerimonas zhaodongensis]RMH87636.1 GntR family transcriptional regulator [Stutzerimonas zhaodongensis]
MLTTRSGLFVEQPPESLYSRPVSYETWNATLNETQTSTPPEGPCSPESVIATLEEEIVLGSLHPRERLVEDELMARFGLKRHVVRNVLGELEQMGLVERKRNVGALVKAYTVEEVEHLYEVRELLETHCMRLINLPVSEERLQPLLAIQTAHDDAVRQGDLRQVFRLNVRFHRELFSLADNPVLVEAITSHAQRAHSIRSSTIVMPAQLERSRQEHWQLIDALRGADRECLVGLCREHLAPSKDAYIQAQRLRAKPIGALSSSNS